MTSASPSEVLLFAYGTLQLETVQLALFGRALDGHPDVLPGYALAPLLVTEPGVIATSGTAHHTIVRKTGDSRDEIPGTLFRITQADLAAADAYEVADCMRVTALLKSGVNAFVYVNAQSNGDPLSFRRDHWG